MARVRVSHRVIESRVRRLLQAKNGGLAKDMMRRGRRVERRAKKIVQVNTGQLRASINTQPTTYRGYPAADIGTNLRHAMWAHDGTGIYGPRGQYITPRRAKVLRWYAKGGKPIFARRVRGMRGSHFLERALPAARD